MIFSLGQNNSKTYSISFSNGMKKSVEKYLVCCESSNYWNENAVTVKCAKCDIREAVFGCSSKDKSTISF